MNANQLAPISSSFYVKNYGSSFIEKIKGLDYFKNLVDDETKNFLLQNVERKVSSRVKDVVLKAFANNSIKIVAFKKEVGLNSYLGLIPMGGPGGTEFFMNIGNYAKFDGNKVNDIDPRVLFSLMVNAYFQYKVITSQSHLLPNIKFQRIIMQAYKKIISAVVSNIVRLNIVTAEEKLAFDLITNIYIAKVLLRKDTSSAISLTKSLTNDKLVNKEKLETQLNNIDANKIDSFEQYILELKRLCPSFIKVSPALIMNEYTRAMKADALLSIDILQVFCGMLMCVEVGSSNIFKDQYVLKILNDSETDHLRNVLV